MAWNGFPPEFKLGAEEQAKVDAYLALIEERSREAASTAAERDALKWCQVKNPYDRTNPAMRDAWEEGFAAMFAEIGALRAKLETAEAERDALKLREQVAALTQERDEAREQVAAVEKALAIVREECDDGRCPSAQHERLAALEHKRRADTVEQRWAMTNVAHGIAETQETRRRVAAESRLAATEKVVEAAKASYDDLVDTRIADDIVHALDALAAGKP